MCVRNKIMTLFCVSAFAFPCGTSWSCGGYDVRQQTAPSLTDHIRRLSKLAGAKSIDPVDLKRVIDDLRLHRQDAVDQLVVERNETITDEDQESQRQLRVFDHAIDLVAGQKSAVESRLFWHTSLTSARRDSVATGKPILSLRLLGRLDQDLSCANSRFFRRVLYPDSEISHLLRERFVLHWESVRDVPIVTIEFGPDRKLRQPMVGNSVHLVLDSRGRPFDAMPGLVSPNVFRNWLSKVDALWQRSASKDQQQIWSDVVLYHRNRATLRRQTSSMAIGPDQAVEDLNPLDPRWRELSLQHYQALSRAGRQRLERHQGVIAERAMITAPSKAMIESPLMRMVRDFEQNINRDTVFNLFALQTKIDDWFAAMSQSPDDQALTRQIYADAFLMPLSDPWLGLSPESTFTALESRGRIGSSAYNELP